MKKITLLILLTMIFAFSRTKYPAQSGREFQILRHNINNIEMCISNFGKFGQDETGSNSGLWWPKYSGYNYIYGAGSWFGTIDPIVGDTMVTIGYGPSGGQSEYTPGKAGWLVSDPDAIIFFYPTTWPSVVPDELEDVFPVDDMGMPKTKSHQDSWCVYHDVDEQQHMAGDTRPIGLEVYQTVYAWNLSATADIIFVKYELKNVTEQLGEAKTLTNCWFGVATDNDIGNEAGGGNDICSAIVGQYYEIDGEDEWIDDLGYQWQAEEETGWDVFPGVIGFDYLQSPYDIVENEDKDGDGILDQYEMDEDWFLINHPPGDPLWDADGDGTPDWRDPSQIPQIGMTSFMRFTLDLEPGSDGERYVCMAGYNYKTLVYVQYDTITPDPDDQRFVQCSGPFELEPDEVITVLVGIMCAAREDADDPPDSAIVRVDKTAQFIFDMNWLLPGPPPSPNLTCVPGDVQITLIWDNIAEIAKDPYYEVVSDPSNPTLYDPYYIEVDFQGYGVWKSLNGQDWELLRRYDIYDNIVFNDTVTGIYADNSGISHVMIDTDVRNGFNYYYAVTSFDYNWVKEAYAYDSIFVIDSVWYDSLSIWVYVYDTVEVTGDGPRPIWFEGGKVSVSTVARRDPGDYIEPGSLTVTVEKGSKRLASLINGTIVYPFEVGVDNPIYIEFTGPDTTTVYVNDTTDTTGIIIPTEVLGAQYTVYIKDTTNNITDSLTPNIVLGTGFALHQFSPLSGIAAEPMLGTDEFPASIQMFESVETENYPEELVNAGLLSPIPNIVSHYDYGFWAYRGTDYEIHWIKTPGSSTVNSIRVIDADWGDEIPFQQFQNDDATKHKGECWCFGGSLLQVAWAFATSDTIILSGPMPGRTKYLYINGGQIAFNNGQPIPDTLIPLLEDEVWIVRANTDYLPASVYGEIRVEATSAEWAAQVDELRVKVVPNPYLVYNEWQSTLYSKRLKFINLPSECIIRIFNLNGELVRTIRHHYTYEPAQGEQEITGSAGGDEWWDLLNDNRQLVASGVYIFHIQSGVGEQVGKFVIIR